LCILSSKSPAGEEGTEGGKKKPIPPGEWPPIKKKQFLGKSPARSHKPPPHDNPVPMEKNMERGVVKTRRPNSTTTTLVLCASDTQKHSRPHKFLRGFNFQVFGARRVLGKGGSPPTGFPQTPGDVLNRLFLERLLVWIHPKFRFLFCHRFPTPPHLGGLPETLLRPPPARGWAPPFHLLFEHQGQQVFLFIRPERGEGSSPAFFPTPRGFLGQENNGRKKCGSIPAGRFCYFF